jgi:hypothetical protein
METTPPARWRRHQGMGSRQIAAAAERVLAADQYTGSDRAQQQWAGSRPSSWRGERSLHQHLQQGAGLPVSSWRERTPSQQQHQQWVVQQQHDWAGIPDSSWQDDTPSWQQHQQQHQREGPPGSSWQEGALSQHQHQGLQHQQQQWVGPQDSSRQEGTLSQQQHHQQQQWVQQPPPPLDWWLQPRVVLPELLQRGAPLLQLDPPLGLVGTSPVVKMHLSQARSSRGNRKRPSNRVILDMMWRIQLQHYSNTDWAVQHQTRGNGIVLATVGDTPEAQAAAREAVAVGHVVVGEGDTELTVPVSWAPFSQPADCVVVTVHQLPPQYARKGVGAVLLIAAEQPGDVVAEFLGGSALTGDAQLSCPCADTVVMWVKPPPDDPLLTRMPSFFDAGIHGWPAVRIEVAGRPSCSPHQWPAITQQLLRRKAAALELIAAAVGPTAHGPSSQQQHRQQGPQQGRQQQQQQQGQAGGSRQPGQPPRQAMLPPSPQQQPQPAPPPRPVARQPLAQQQPQQRQQPDVDAGSDMLLDSEPETVARRSPQQQRPPQQQQQGAARMHADPWDLGAQHRQWLQQQEEDMLGIAVRLAEDEAEGAARSLTQQQRQDLPEAFCERFSNTLQQEISPPPAAVLRWLRQQLGIQHTSYGSDSGTDSGVESGADASDEDRADVLARDAQDQQQGEQLSTQQGPRQRRRRKNKQQQQPQAPQPQACRRSGRINAGRMSAEFASIHGPAGCTQREGRVGSGSSQRASGAGILPPTPAATHNPRRARQRAQGPS